ncbi:galectin-9 isoform X1 [Monodelphis domestica]|uniref:galectin-9 isoform X1 n=1 Tax=Monodelphis domestica TaxID=13616 RepID=UPI00028BEA7C|nr:galectin-9 isoform X1 [Monodelphis domestica]
MSFNNSQNQYQNVCIPFCGPIPGGLQVGHEVTVNGAVLRSGTNRFSVNFQCGFDGNNIAFHFNPRFDGGSYVVCNTKHSGSWGPEERKMQMPFTKGMPFEIRFQLQNEAFSVIVNGNYFLRYEHRMAFQKVDTIAIEGMVMVSFIRFQNSRSAPIQPSCVVLPAAFLAQCSPRSKENKPKPPDPVWPPAGTIISQTFIPGVHSAMPSGPFLPPSLFSGPLYPLPFRTSISGGLYPNRIILVSGSILPTANRFEINLKCGNDIAFHLNPRFCENAVVRNTQINRSWGSEERGLPGCMPFARGQSFMVCIRCDVPCLKVTVNGCHQFDYKHRIRNLLSINQLEVSGDIQLTQVQV